MPRDFDDAVIVAVDQAWGTLLGSQPSYDGDRERSQQPPMTVCASGGIAATVKLRHPPSAARRVAVPKGPRTTSVGTMAS